MQKVETARIWRFLVPLLIVGSMIACNEEPGLVGQSFVESSQEFTFDTLYINNLEQVSFGKYSGQLLRTGVGSYQDPIFGDVTAKTVIKPSITDISGLGFILGSADVQLRIRFDQSQVWGDTNAVTQYNIYRVNNLWRSFSYLADDPIDVDNARLVSTFSRTNEESVILDLSPDFVDEYAALYNADDNFKDSLFAEVFNGLVIEPALPSSNISFIDMSNTELIVQNPEDTAIVEIPMREWAYSVEQDNESIPANNLVMSSTNKEMLTANFFDLFSSYNQSNIIKVELVVFEDTVAMGASLPDGHVRTVPLLLSSHQDLGFDQNYDFTFGTADSLGFTDDQNSSYRFNLTAYVNRFLFGDGLNDDFFFTIFERTGFLNSTIIHDENGDPARRPIIIITTIQQ